MNEKDIKYSKIYDEISRILGKENTEKIHKHFKGQQLSLPMRLYSNESVGEYLQAKYSGQKLEKKDLKELSNKFDYSERWIRKLIKYGAGKK
ncbi:Mor transcription activator family protein [Clostridioides difficile]|uniref:Mor transcription activator family protein n=1 Tax=unclassified Clostridioides TaxID=2635829 RepID=UPI001693ED87|nr:Mor transcription activator family protein [Clostridioides sp. ES-S-0171-01]MCC0689472.1 Mor transcription activator family protein [Clostridioides sp. ES-S-0056-01]NJI78945.1 Mor transcription activator family protein [Clostridioides difficile]UDN55835.1 Mor transcription activator family protein [Clostridioides sp. ES-S-0054-01]